MIENYDALKQVQDVYSGAEGNLWRMVMGEQIHIGGMTSSMALCGKAGIAPGSKGVDLCCCNGGGMRFLTRFCGVGGMTGVDATNHVISQGIKLCEDEGLADKIEYVHADATKTGLPAGEADFVWGEDAWCYVENKAALIAEASRIVKPGGTIAFTDWVEGPAGMTDAERTRFNAFMKFPNVQTIAGYAALLESNGCEIVVAEDTEQFGKHVDLYLNMLNMQLTYDALKIIGFNMELMQAMGGEMVFMQGLAHAGKIAPGLFVARKK